MLQPTGENFGDGSYIKYQYTDNGRKEVWYSPEGEHVSTSYCLFNDDGSVKIRYDDMDADNQYEQCFEFSYSDDCTMPRGQKREVSPEEQAQLQAWSETMEAVSMEAVQEPVPELRQ